VTKHEADDVRAAVQRERRRGRARFSRELRDRVLEYARWRWAEGASIETVSSEVGVSAHTLSYWRAVERIGKSKVRPVQIVAARPVDRTVIAAGPHGLRLQLTLDDVAELLRKLG
jgi:hypothetical protein